MCMSWQVPSGRRGKQTLTPCSPPSKSESESEKVRKSLCVRVWERVGVCVREIERERARGRDKRCVSGRFAQGRARPEIATLYMSQALSTRIGRSGLYCKGALLTRTAPPTSTVGYRKAYIYMSCRILRGSALQPPPPRAGTRARPEIVAL